MVCAPLQAMVLAESNPGANMVPDGQNLFLRTPCLVGKGTGAWIFVLAFGMGEST